MSTTPVYTYTYDHIHVRTKDPEGMASFFETMFGAKVLRLIQSDGVPRVDLDVNGLAIFIASVPPEEHIDLSPRDPHLGLDHFGFRVDDIDGAVEDLRSKGAEIYVEPRTIRPGVRIAFVRGPDDVRIEILQRDGSGLMEE
ncbi:MAG: VOC family protein [Chloroflexota bacterium]|nr:VOC family protein [Chloroflexota bacterium]MDE2960429.1 VOC family protein [Chloroflexota bacterium]